MLSTSDLKGSAPGFFEANPRSRCYRPVTHAPHLIWVIYGFNTSIHQFHSVKADMYTNKYRLIP